MRIFITGGSRGIGAQLVKSCVEAGHDVAFTYQSAKDNADNVVEEAFKLVKTSEQRCQAWQLDVRDPLQVETVCEAIIEEFEGIDAVINNAAIVRIGMAATLPDQDWQDVIATNLSGPFYVSRFFLNEFLINGGGRFIHISSVARNGMNGQVAYCASKAGLDGLSGSLAKEYGRKNITSNVLCLGFFETDMTKTDMTADRKQSWNEFCPAGRMGKLSEICSTTLFLMSEDAAYINGQTINLTGGMDWVT
jgi:3-oxoacyl-[acyl-carrier protein] reductase